MNRFYKVNPNQPVNTMVDIPWEFLQSSAINKQKEFDTTGASIGATGELFKNLRVHQDTFGAEKNQRVSAYNQALTKIGEDLRTTGNTSQAARDLFKVRSAINQDDFILNAPEESKKIWEAEKRIAENKKTVSNYNMFFPKYMQEYTSNYRNADGTIRNFNPGTLYEEDIDLADAAKKTVGNIANSGFNFSGEEWDMESGVIRNTTTGQVGVSDKNLKAVIAPKVLDFLKSDAGIQFMRRENHFSKNPLTDEEIYKSAENFLISSNLHQLGLVTTNKTSSSFIPEHIRNPKQPIPPTPPIADEIVLVDENTKPITMDDLSKSTTNYKTESRSITSPVESATTKTKVPITYKDLSSGYKKSFDTFMDTFFEKSELEGVKKGTVNAEKYYPQFVEYYNAVNSANAVPITKRPVVSKDKIFNLGLGERNNIKADELINAALGVTENTLLYSNKEKKIIRFSKINNTTNKKAINYSINQESVGPNPFYLKFNKDPKYAKVLMITGEDGSTYYMPGNLNKNSPDYDTNIMLNEIGQAKGFGGMPVRTDFANIRDIKVAYINGNFVVSQGTNADNIVRTKNGHQAEIIPSVTEAGILEQLKQLAELD
jgi:hypothetical protein